MIIPLVVLAGAVALAWLAIAKGRSTEAFRRITVPGELVDSARHARRGFVRRIALAALAAGALGGVAVALSDAAPASYGLVPLLAPGIASLACLAVIAALPRVLVPEANAKRSAELTARRAWTFAPAWSWALPAATGALLLAAIVVLGLTSWPQEDGLYRAVHVESGDYASTAGPYPGWFYGLPVAALAIAVAVAAYVALARVAASARPTEPALREVDRVMRIVTSRVIMKLTAGTFAAYLGVLLFAGGTSLMSAAGQWHDGAYSEIEPFTTLGMGELFTGLAVLVGGLALVVLAVIDAVKPPFTVHVAEPAVAAAP
jgi:hypothetical protein